MTEEWVKQKKEERQKWMDEMYLKTKDFIKTRDYFSDSQKEKYLTMLEEVKENPDEHGFLFSLKFSPFSAFFNSDFDDLDKLDDVQKDFYENDIDEYIEALNYSFNYERYLDMEKKFDGDIVITDPCYFIKEDDWSESYCGFRIELIGLKPLFIRDTIYGDWLCAVYNSLYPNSPKIGTFCADSGLVCVADLDEILEYNPDFKERLDDGIATVIRDFTGIITFKVEEEECEYFYDCGKHKKGDKYKDYYLVVYGNGVNKKTGEWIRFFSRQIGF